MAVTAGNHEVRFALAYDATSEINRWRVKVCHSVRACWESGFLGLFFTALLQLAHTDLPHLAFSFGLPGPLYCFVAMLALKKSGMCRLSEFNPARLSGNIPERFDLQKKALCTSAV